MIGRVEITLDMGWIQVKSRALVKVIQTNSSTSATLKINLMINKFK